MLEFQKLSLILLSIDSKAQEYWYWVWWCSPLIPALRRQRQGRSLGLQGQSGLQREFQDSQSSYTEKTCLEKLKKNHIDIDDFDIAKMPEAIYGNI